MKLYNIKKKEKDYKITTVCKDDMRSIGFDVSSLRDKDMKDIAQKMAESYCECCFWNSLESILIDEYKLKQHNI